MALKAGRVGVKPSEVTKSGKIKGGGGGSPYVLPVANATTLGGVKPVTKTEAMTKEVGVDSEGRLYVEPSESGPTNILSGTDPPIASMGSDGDLYLQTGFNGALLHFDDSATTDEVIGNTWTGSGAPTVSDAQKKFGTKSLYLDGSSYLQSNINADNFNFGSDDFTISCWMYPTSTSRAALFAMSSDCKIGTDVFFGQGSANLWMSSNGSSWNVIQSDNSGANTGQGTIALSANEWAHIAYVRKGDKVRMFVNGQIAREVTLSSSDTVVAWSGNDGFRIGAWGGNPVDFKFNGYIDEFLILKGTALWDTPFTPPTEAFDISEFDYIVATYAKVSGAWQNLIGTDIDDVNTGGGELSDD